MKHANDILRAEAEDHLVEYFQGPAHILVQDADIIRRMDRDFSVLVAMLHPECSDFCLLETDERSDTLRFWEIVMGHQHFDVNDMVRDVVRGVVSGWYKEGWDQ